MTKTLHMPPRPIPPPPAPAIPKCPYCGQPNTKAQCSNCGAKAGA